MLSSLPFHGLTGYMKPEHSFRAESTARPIFLLYNWRVPRSTAADFRNAGGNSNESQNRGEAAGAADIYRGLAGDQAGCLVIYKRGFISFSGRALQMRKMGPDKLPKAIVPVSGVSRSCLTSELSFICPLVCPRKGCIYSSC